MQLRLRFGKKNLPTCTYSSGGQPNNYFLGLTISIMKYYLMNFNQINNIQQNIPAQLLLMWVMNWQIHQFETGYSSTKLAYHSKKFKTKKIKIVWIWPINLLICEHVIFWRSCSSHLHIPFPILTTIFCIMLIFTLSKNFSETHIFLSFSNLHMMVQNDFLPRLCWPLVVYKVLKQIICTSSMRI